MLGTGRRADQHVRIAVPVDIAGGGHCAPQAGAYPAAQHRPAYGSDGDYFSKPNREQVFEAVYDLMHASAPARFTCSRVSKRSCSSSSRRAFTVALSCWFSLRTSSRLSRTSSRKARCSTVLRSKAGRASTSPTWC